MRLHYYFSEAFLLKTLSMFRKVGPVKGSINHRQNHSHCELILLLVVLLLSQTGCQHSKRAQSALLLNPQLGENRQLHTFPRSICMKMNVMNSNWNSNSACLFHVLNWEPLPHLYIQTNLLIFGEIAEPDLSYYLHIARGQKKCTQLSQGYQRVSECNELNLN